LRIHAQIPRRSSRRDENLPPFAPQGVGRGGAEKAATADDDDAVHEPSVEAVRSARPSSTTHGQNSAKSTVVETAIASGLPASEAAVTNPPAAHTAHVSPRILLST